MDLIGQDVVEKETKSSASLMQSDCQSSFVKAAQCPRPAVTRIREKKTRKVVVVLLAIASV